MKSTGIIRQMDGLGRIVLPKELRTANGIERKDPIEIFTEGAFILLRKYELTCAFCGDAEDVFEFEGKKVCRNCLEKMNLNSALQ